MFGLSFHFVLLFFYFFANVCFFKYVFCQVHLLCCFTYLLSNLFLVIFIFLFCTIFIIAMKEGQSIVAMDDLDFEIIHVVFKAKCSISIMAFLIELQIGA